MQGRWDALSRGADPGPWGCQTPVGPQRVGVSGEGFAEQNHSLFSHIWKEKGHQAKVRKLSFV